MPHHPSCVCPACIRRRWDVVNKEEQAQATLKKTGGKQAKLVASWWVSAKEIGNTGKQNQQAQRHQPNQPGEAAGIGAGDESSCASKVISQGPQAALSDSPFATLGRWGDVADDDVDHDDYDSDDNLWQEAGEKQRGKQAKGGRKQQKGKSQNESDDEYLDSAILQATREREEATEGLKVTMYALGFDEDEIDKIITAKDDEGDDSISYEDFQKWLAAKVLNRDPDKTFRLSDYPQVDRVPPKHLKRAARELGERMAEEGYDICDEGPAWGSEPSGLPPEHRRAGERT